MPEPQRAVPDPVVGARFAALRRTDTTPEIETRRKLHSRGLRYRVHARVPGLPRRRVDILFTRARLAVSIDGCFWHGCPDHWTRPHTNSEWWDWKIATNQARDADTDAKLEALGYVSLRLWEHVPPAVAADLISAQVDALRRR